MRSARLILLAAASSIAIGAAALPMAAMAQTAPAASVAASPPSDPWAHEASDIPADPAVRFGILPNGLRYAVMHNATPPGQASLRVRIDAGSLMERDDQRGLAHFMEHMAFNGTQGVPEGQLLPMLERLGLAFGADTNASTGFDETVYKLDLPRTDDEVVDASLNILREMTGKALLETAAIDRERGIILSEERTRAGPGLRSALAQLAFLLPGQLVPNRLPIGDTSVLQNAPRERFVEFYEAYYRPSRTTVIAVGDFDVAEMEAKIIATFSDWTAPAAPEGAEPDLGVVQRRTAEAGVYVEPGVSSSIQVVWTSPPDMAPDTRAKQQQDLVQVIGLQILNRRFQTLAREENPPFLGAGAGRSTAFRSVETATIQASYQPGRWSEALTAIEQEKRRIEQHGVTQAELDRVVTEFRAALQNAVAGAATRRTVGLAEGISASVNSDDVFTSPQTDLEIFESVAGTLTVDQVNASLKTAFAGDGPLVFVTSPDAIEGGEAGVLQALTASQAVAVSAPDAREVAAWPYSSFGQAAQPVSQTVVADIEITFVTFPNGVRLTVKPTTFQDDRILVAVRVGQGYLALPTDRAFPSWAAGAISEGGLGSLTADQIDEILAGKTYSDGFSIGEDAFVLSGSTKPEDLALQLQVLTAYLTDAAWRTEPFERTRTQLSQALPQLSAVPAGVFSREANGLLRSGDPRWVFPTADQIAGASPADLQAVIEASIDQGPIEVVIVGDVTLEDAIAQVGATLGALPARPAAPPVATAAAAVRFPAGVAEPVTLTHAGRADQALGFVGWPAVDNFTNPREARLVRLLADVMRLRLIEELREGQAVTYSPSVGASASSTFAGYGYMSASIQAPPEKLGGFFADVDTIAAALAETPITADELERARRPRIEALRRSQATNEFWLGELQEAQTDPARLPAIRTVISDLESATPEELQRVARQYLVPGSAYRIQVTPAAPAQ